MINRIFRIALFAVLALLLFASCENPMVRQILPYTVDFNSNGGDPAPKSQRLMRGDKVSVPRSMTRTGCDFDGWYTSSNFAEGSKWDFNTRVADDFTLYAKWDPKIFSVSFEPNGGEPAPAQKYVEYGNLITVPAEMSKPGHIFGGWFKDAAFEHIWHFNTDTVTADITLHANWIDPSMEYTVTFDLDGGEGGTPADQIVNYAKNFKATEPPVPIKPGHNFLGWFDNTVTPQEKWDFDDRVHIDMELTAHWDIKTFIVTFDANGGTFTEGGGESVIKVSVKWGTVVAELEVTRENYDLLYWDKSSGPDGGVYNFDSPVDESFTLFAEWKGIPCTVEFIPNGGTPEPDELIITVDYGSYITEPDEMAKDDHTFGGWFIDEDHDHPWHFNEDTVAGDMKLYAEWIDDSEFNVKFELDGGEGSDTTTQTVNRFNDFKIIAPAPGPVKTGYSFVGWFNDDVTPHEKWDFNDRVHKDMTLTAHWKIKTFFVTFNPNEGNWEDDSTENIIESAVYNTYVSAPEDFPFRASYEFDDWYTEPISGGVKFDPDAPVTEDKTYYARWDPIRVTGISLRENSTSLGLVIETLPNGEIDLDEEQLYFDIFPADALVRTVTWFSNNTDVATISASGVVKATNMEDVLDRVGTAKITVTTDDGGFTDDCLIQVLDVSVVPIPATTSFSIGSPSGELGRDAREKEYNNIKLTGFNMGKYAVTQRQFQKVMGNNPSNFNGIFNDVTNTLFPGHLPVERVSWYAALVFCNRLSVLHGLTPVYSISSSTNPDTWITAAGGIPTTSNNNWNNATMVSGTGYRLPTSTQWEYACRGGDTVKYPFNFGASITITNIDTTYMNYNGTQSTTQVQQNLGYTTEVGSYLRPNSYGLYEMHGNVMEWCWDRAVEVNTANSTDPTGSTSTSTTTRVRRGGAFPHPASEGRTAYWYWSPPSDMEFRLGFRITRSLD